MKIQVLSDLHLEYSPFCFEPVDADLCVIAGDVSPQMHDVVALIEEIKKHYPVVFVPGNHEYYPTYRECYGEPISQVDAWYRNTIGRAFFQQDVRRIEGKTIAGCTLWTDFFNCNVDAMRVAQRQMPDFSLILVEPRQPFTPSLAAGLHKEMRNFLCRTKADVIVTHHAPSRKSIGTDFTGHALNSCFVNDMEDVIIKTGARLWVHGHTHDATSYFVNDCRVLCNPRGYQGKGYLEQTGFDPRLVVQI